MILFLFGTEKWPFRRLADAADLVAERFEGEQVLAQIGNHTPPPGKASWERWLSFREFGARITEARLVVAHGGSGSILTCLANERVPVVIPRRKTHGEHVDDHQVELASKMAELGNCLLAESPEEVLAALADYDARLAASRRATAGQRHLADTLAEYLAELS